MKDHRPITPATEREQVAQLARMFGDVEDHRDAIDRARENFRTAYDQMQRQAGSAGLEIHGKSTVARVLYAGRRYADAWERRVKALEKVLKDVLASDSATDEQREAMMRALCGRTSQGRDPKLLSEAEAALIAHYRASDAADKQMLRTLLARLARNTGIQ
jgi:hypothetical protein